MLHFSNSLRGVNRTLRSHRIGADTIYFTATNGRYSKTNCACIAVNTETDIGYR